MKQEQNNQQQYTPLPEDILLTPIHIKMQKQTNQTLSFQFDQAQKYMQTSMSQNKQNTETDSNKKIELVNLLLNVLGYSKSAKVFQKEAMEQTSSRNPQITSSKKSKRVAEKMSLNYKIQQIINANTNFEEMLNSLALTLKQEQQQKMIQEIVDQSYQICMTSHRNLQKAVQNMFPKKQTTTLPIYQCLQVDFGSKQIKFADINSQQDVCILDNQNTLSVIEQTNRNKVSRTLLQQKLHIIDLKWVNSHILVLLTSSNKVLLYNKKMVSIRSFRPHKMPITSHQICVIKNTPNSQCLYILAANKHLLVPFKINLDGNNIVEESLPSFETEYELNAIAIIKVPHRVTFHRPLNNFAQQTEFNIVTQIEHFYGLTEKMKKIVKFDSIVEQSGIIWECRSRQFISEIKSSECGHFLQMLIVSSQNEFLDTCKVERVSFIKMSASGCIVQKLQMTLQNICKDIFLRYKFVYGRLNSLNKNMRWFKLEPYWVRCFAYNNIIYYVSLKTGNLLFSQQIEKNEIKLHCAGKQNAVLYQSNGKLTLISTKDQPKKNVTLQNRRSPDLRESLIQRFSRIHGIPQNLLLLLRTIRNNDIELQEISE